jgi:hypothetical protein
MNYWFVIHDYSAFELEPKLIGQDMRLKGKISRISKGDKILYYATGDMVIINSYDIISDGFEYTSEIQKHPWNGTLWSYKIRDRGKKNQKSVPIQEIVKKLELEIFPDHIFQHIKFKGQTIVKISSNDFNKIEKFIKNYKKSESKEFKGAPNEGNLGAPIDLEILNYEPTSEQGVVVLFAAFMKKLPQGFVKIEFVRSGFPDACVIQKDGNRYIRKYIEFEFKASGFKIHIRNEKHRDIKCDFVVCWEDDFKTCPVTVIELKKELQKILKQKR